MGTQASTASPTDLPVRDPGHCRVDHGLCNYSDTLRSCVASHDGVEREVHAMGGVMAQQGRWWRCLDGEPTCVNGEMNVGTWPSHGPRNACLDSDMYISRNGQRTIVTRAAMGAVNGVSGEGHRWTVG